MGGQPGVPLGEQVGPLFVTLLTLLIAATVAVVGRRPRERSAAQQVNYERAKRGLRAVWVGTGLFWLAWMGGAVVAALLFGGLSFVALREFVTLTRVERADRRSVLFAFFLILPLQFALAGSRQFNLFTVLIPVYVFFTMPVLSALGNGPHRLWERNAKTQWGTMVFIYGMSHAPALLWVDAPGSSGRGAFLVFYLVVVVASTQVAHAVASRHWQRRSWFAGVLASALVGATLYWATPFQPISALVLGLIVGAAASLGRVVVQSLQGDADMRRWGDQPSVTGAIGLLERVVPMCMAAPVVFHAARWAIGH